MIIAVSRFGGKLVTNNTLAAVVLTMVTLGLCGVVSAATPPIVLTFDDIQVFPRDYIPISGTNYAGFEWSTNSTPDQNHGGVGFWLIDNAGPNPTGQGLVNGFGSSELSISFPQLVEVQGMLAAGQGTPPFTASGIRFHGYLNSQPVADSDWFRNLVRYQPVWLPLNFPPIDKLIVEADASSNAVAEGKLWGAYRLDDFTYVPVPEPATLTATFALLPLLFLGHRLHHCRPRCS